MGESSWVEEGWGGLEGWISVGGRVKGTPWGWTTHEQRIGKQQKKAGKGWWYFLESIRDGMIQGHKVRVYENKG